MGSNGAFWPIQFNKKTPSSFFFICSLQRVTAAYLPSAQLQAFGWSWDHPGPWMDPPLNIVVSKNKIARLSQFYKVQLFNWFPLLVIFYFQSIPWFYISTYFLYDLTSNTCITCWIFLILINKTRIIFGGTQIGQVGLSF